MNLQEANADAKAKGTAQTNRFRGIFEKFIQGAVGIVGAFFFVFWLWGVFSPSKVVVADGLPYSTTRVSVAVAGRPSCYVGDIRYTSATFTEGAVEVINAEECHLSPRVKAGRVQFEDHRGNPIGQPWTPDLAPTPVNKTIATQAKCLSAICEVKYLLCPNGHGPLQGSWDCT